MLYGIIAGAGIKRGYVHGESDKTGSSPLDNSVHPRELLATIYHGFGIDPETIVYNHLNQPRELVKAQAVYRTIFLKLKEFYDFPIRNAGCVDSFYFLCGCNRKVVPQKVDEEVRKLLDGVPGFDWETREESRLDLSGSDRLPVPPMDDNASRKITLRIQKMMHMKMEIFLLF